MSTADGLPDILLPGEYSDTVTVLPSAAGGIVTDLKLDYATGGGPNVSWLAAGDLNGDGRVDLVFPVAGDAVAVFLNNTCFVTRGPRRRCRSTTASSAGRGAKRPGQGHRPGRDEPSTVRGRPEGVMTTKVVMQSHLSRVGSPGNEKSPAKAGL